jgi:protoheme IX farnesyltransferase
MRGSLTQTTSGSAAIGLEAPLPWAALTSRCADYLVLIKPRIAVMVLAVVSVGYAVGCRGEFAVLQLLHALLGIGAVAAGCSALNQWLEHETDARMPRTSGRPIPAGRMPPREALACGVALGAFGGVWLVVFVNTLTALLTLATLVAYVGVYTPLKRWTSLCTAIGAVPGAMPPVLGWTAAGGELDSAALVLFGVLLLWQFPHFLAIAWLYREQYDQAGLQMLPRRRTGGIVGRLAVTYALALIPISLLPRQLGLAGDAYFAVALALGLAYLAAAWAFQRDESRRTARWLLLTSLVYLPALFGSLTFDHWRLLQ